MSSLPIKLRMFKLGVKGVALIKEINNRQFPYAGGHNGTLKVSSSEMSKALNDVEPYPKHQAILKAADQILTEMEKGRIN